MTIHPAMMTNDYKTWLHGTDEYFTAWCPPPVASPFKSSLQSHPFISLTQDTELARKSGLIAGGLCQTQLVQGAKIIDLRQQTEENERHWKEVASSNLGKLHSLVQSFDTWTAACSSGEILRYQTSDDNVGQELQRLQLTATSPNVPVKFRQQAFLNAQNFTRSWINLVLMPAKRSGYDGVLCAEIDRHRKTGAKNCINLYVFNPQVLEPPVWVSKPDVQKASEYLKRKPG